MSKINYSFLKVPNAVYYSSISAYSKLLFAYMVSREDYYVSQKGYKRGSFIQCYLRTLAKKTGKSTDSVRKNYIPELIDAGFLEKKTVGGKKGDKKSAECLFRIVWENIESDKTNKNNQNNK